MEPLQIELGTPAHYHLGRTLSVLQMGHHDPSFFIAKNVAQLCRATPMGSVSVGTVQIDRQLQVTCHGPGSSWIEPRLAALFGLEDDPESFQPTGKMKQLGDRFRGLHLPRLTVVLHRLVQIVLLKLVSWNDAFRAWRLLTLRRIGKY